MLQINLLLHFKGEAQSSVSTFLFKYGHLHLCHAAYKTVIVSFIGFITNQLPKIYYIQDLDCEKDSLAWDW